MIKSVLRAICFWVFVSFIAVGTAFAGIRGSFHDFKSVSWNPSGEICIVCHTPHNAGSTIAPLWNHAVSKAVYTVYSSPTLKASVGQPGGSSKACLSCHDGTVAIDAFGGNPGKAPLGCIQCHSLGVDLSNDHPVSFTYNTALATADGGLHDPATKTVAALGGKTVKDGMLLEDKVECPSCHDVHKTKGYSATSPQMLIVNNSGSGLCLTCHNK